MGIRALFAICAGFILLLGAPAAAATMPEQIGQCVNTTIKNVETRLVDGQTNRPVPGSGSAVTFANGGYQVSYETVAAVEQSRAGDPVTMCLVSIPKGCPPGDARGRIYKTTNRRTHGSWTLPDAEHRCGGA
jgi:hypothetical protein